MAAMAKFCDDVIFGRSLRVLKASILSNEFIFHNTYSDICLQIDVKSSFMYFIIGLCSNHHADVMKSALRHLDHSEHIHSLFYKSIKYL